MRAVSGLRSAPDVDLTGRTLLGKYEIEGLIGQGGMGAVWRARHALTGRKLAVKTLDESYVENRAVVERFGREARAASACRHPGIVEVLDLDRTEEGIPFLVMEFLDGEDLARRIERRGRLSQEEILDLGTKLLEALEAAHESGVIHRDLKPENIYVVPAGRRGETVKIVDFGISHKRDEAADKLTMTGSVLGTPHYMSPEQAMGETEADHRADIYAVGVVLYECAVGDVPFDAPNYNKLLRTILDQQPVPPRRRGAQISVELERVILWAMEKERDLRLGSAREMIEWLASAAEGRMPPYRIPTPQPRASTSSSGTIHAQPELYTPAGALPPRRVALAPTLADDELSPSWASSEPPAAERPAFGAYASSELELGPDLDRRPSTSPPRTRRSSPPAALELDESALRPSVPPAAGLASSPGTIASPAIGTAMRTGAHPAAPRVSELTGRYTPVSSRPPPSVPVWRRYALAGAGGLLVFVGSVVLVRWLIEPGMEPPSETIDAPVVPSEEPAPRVPAWVSVTIEGLPPGAQVRLDGLPASSPIRLPRGGAHVVEIRADGYEDRRIDLVADRNQIVRADLRPALVEPTVAPRRASPPAP